MTLTIDPDDFCVPEGRKVNLKNVDTQGARQVKPRCNTSKRELTGGGLPMNARELMDTQKMRAVLGP